MKLKYRLKTCLRKVFGKNFVCWLLYARNKILNIDLFQILHTNDTNVFYFYISPKLKHPGLADRLKAIISGVCSRLPKEFLCLKAQNTQLPHAIYAFIHRTCPSLHFSYR